VISILNRLKLRILQGDFNGRLNVRMSQLYDFAVEDHEDLMKLVMCWLMPVAHGDTTLSTQLPLIRQIQDADNDVDNSNSNALAAEVEVATPT
jgi:hypothetical protein